MAKDKEVIKNEIEEFVKENGGTYADYYIGITKNIERRIVENNESVIEHLQKGEYTEGNPIYSEECVNRDEAMEIERFFQDKRMEKFNPRSFGVDESKFIYCYKMRKENKEKILEGNSEKCKEKATNIKRFKDFKMK